MLREPTYAEYPSSFGIAEALDAVKNNVGPYKLRYGEEAWKNAVQSTSHHASLPDTSDRPISRAYFKLVEIMRTTIVKPPRTTLHVCEAPGGFAQAVLTEFPTCKKIHVTSLARGENPGVPFFSQYLLHRPNVHHIQYGGADDVMQRDFRDCVVRDVGRVDLVTADGGIDVDSQPEMTELACAALVLCQVDVALRAQATGGTFVLKVFGIAQPITCEIIALLTQCYDTVSLLKPMTSHAVNDERYVVCQGFRGDRIAVPDLGDAMVRGPPYVTHIIDSLDAEWLRELNNVVHMFLMQQKSALHRALTFKSTSSSVGANDPRRNGNHRAKALQDPTSTSLYKRNSQDQRFPGHNKRQARTS